MNDTPITVRAKVNADHDERRDRIRLTISADLALSILVTDENAEQLRDQLHELTVVRAGRREARS